MWYPHIWPTLILAIALETDIVFSYLGYDGRHAPRQASLPAPTITTIIDHSSVGAPTPASRPSDPAIVIPFLPPSITTTSTLLTTSALSSVSSSSQNTPTSTPTYSLSSTALSTSSAQIATARQPFKVIYLVPAFALVGILLGGLIGWVVYGCMTRKPRVREDDGALFIGPRYIGINESEPRNIQHHDMEQKAEPKQIKNLPTAIRASPHFRWPSFNEKPAFDPVQGFHVPAEYMHDDDPFLALPLTTRLNTNVNTRTKSTRTTRTSKSVRTFKSTRSTAAGLSRNFLPSPASDATSLALLELYESDEEEETRRKAREVPWESLRHKSIKRGILEQVKEEGKWMDSIRGLASSTLLSSRPETSEEGNVLLGGPDADDSMEVESYVGRRRGYSVPDSDPFADSPTRIHSISPKKRPAAKSRRTDSTTTTVFPASVEPHGVGFQIISESAATTPNHSPRCSFAWHRKDDVPEKLTRLPTPIARVRKQSQSSRSSSPIKRSNGLDIFQVPRRDILPRSPAQIMSPPLHSQICFTPTPTSMARVHPQSSRGYHLKSRVSVSLSPTKPLTVSIASKGKRKTQSPRNLHRLPKPPSFANTVVSDVLLSKHEVSRGRPLQRPNSVATNNNVAGRSKWSGNEAAAADTRANMLEDPIKKVERIMASSWSVRDLGQEGMRNLSPSGFGRHP